MSKKIDRQTVRDADEAFLAIRQNGEGRWMDLSTLSYSREVSEKKSAKTDQSIPLWSKDNPVIAFAQVKVVIDQILS